MKRSSGRKGSSENNPWFKRNIRKILFIVFLIGFLYYLLFGSYGIINIVRLKRNEIILRQKKEELLLRKEALIDSLKLLREDTLLLEKIAREKLGMIKPGDTVYLEDE